MRPFFFLRLMAIGSLALLFFAPKLLGQCPFMLNGNLVPNNGTYTIYANQLPAQLVGVEVGGTFSGEGVANTSSPAIFNPDVVDIPGVFNVTYNNGCSVTIPIQVLPFFTVGGNPPIFANNPPLVTICSTELPATLVGYPSNGSFAGVGVIGNVFNPINIPGTFAVGYTLPNGAFINYQVQVLDVSQTPSIILPEDDNIALCEDAAPVALSGNFDGMGGVFTLNGALVTQFDPQQAGTGNFEVLYNFIDPSTGCVIRDSVAFNVFGEPNAEFTGWQPTYCLTDQPTILTGTSVQGIFSGNGVTASNTFDPALAGPGIHQITHTYTDFAQICSNTASVEVEVFDTISIDFSVPVSQCFTPEEAFIYTGDPVGANANYVWTVTGGSISQDKGDTLLVSWAGGGEKSVSLTVEGDLCTGYTRTYTFDRNMPDVEAGTNQVINQMQSASINATATSTALPLTYQWSPIETLTCSNCLNPTAAPQQTTTYVLTVSDANGCSAQDSLTISVITVRDVFVPNAFTPNDDDNNDKLLVYGSEMSTFTLQIFDRWGAKMFETSNPDEGWDGTFNRSPVNAGTYVYVLDVTFVDGQKELYRGSVTLIR